MPSYWVCFLNVTQTLSRVLLQELHECTDTRTDRCDGKWSVHADQYVTAAHIYKFNLCANKVNPCVHTSLQTLNFWIRICLQQSLYACGTLIMPVFVSSYVLCSEPLQHHETETRLISVYRFNTGAPHVTIQLIVTHMCTCST